MFSRNLSTRGIISMKPTRRATTPLGDPEALRAAIQHLLDDPALRQRLGAHAAEAYERDHGTLAFTAAVIAAIAHTPQDRA